MGKATHTRQAILDEAVELTSVVGLEALSLGMLAKQAAMSKSGVYAHFDSKEDLQCAVLDSVAERFVAAVYEPALAAPRGLPRLEEVFARWLRWSGSEFAGGCPFIGASTEFDDRPGRVRDRLAGHLRRLHEGLARTVAQAVAEGHLAVDLDVRRFVYALWGMLLAHHSHARLLGSEDAPALAAAAFRQLVDSARPA